MGFYIDQTSKGTPLGRHDKAETLVREGDAILLNEQPQWKDVPADTAIICVVNNGPFEAAGFAFSEDEFNVFARPDGRPRQWLTMKREVAEKLSGFRKS
jgi:hypothetical protein